MLGLERALTPLQSIIKWSNVKVGSLRYNMVLNALQCIVHICKVSNLWDEDDKLQPQVMPMLSRLFSVVGEQSTASREHKLFAATALMQTARRANSDQLTPLLNSNLGVYALIFKIMRNFREDRELIVCTLRALSNLLHVENIVDVQVQAVKVDNFDPVTSWAFVAALSRSTTIEVQRQATQVWIVAQQKGLVL